MTWVGGCKKMPTKGRDKHLKWKFWLTFCDESWWNDENRRFLGPLRVGKALTCCFVLPNELLLKKQIRWKHVEMFVPVYCKTNYLFEKHWKHVHVGMFFSFQYCQTDCPIKGEYLLRSCSTLMPNKVPSWKKKCTCWGHLCILVLPNKLPNNWLHN